MKEVKPVLTKTLLHTDINDKCRRGSLDKIEPLAHEVVVFKDESGLDEDLSRE
jgi:hypothetical protein